MGAPTYVPILTCEHCGKPACNFTLGLLKKKKVYVLKALVQPNSFLFFFQGGLKLRTL